MGFDLHRFAGAVDEELLCPICKNVLEDPVQVPCEHAFCRSCIQHWLSVGGEDAGSCPVDRQPLQTDELRPLPRLLKNMLAKLMVSCIYKEYGCKNLVRLETLEQHTSACSFNPKFPVLCQGGCGLKVPKDELQKHNCVKELRAVVTDQKCELSELREELRNCVRQQKQAFQSKIMELNNNVSGLRQDLNDSKSYQDGKLSDIRQDMASSLARQDDKLSKVQQELRQTINSLNLELQKLKLSDQQPRMRPAPLASTSKVLLRGGIQLHNDV